MEHCDVVVIGAGVSGLAVARGIVAGNRTVTVLEARDRVGGRLDSIDGLDLGASWFWPNEPRVRSLVSELGVAVHEQHLHGNARYHDPVGARDLDGNPLDVASFRFSNGADSLARAMATSLPDGTVQLATAVDRISVGSAGVVIHAGDVAVRSEHVVVALPPSLAVQSLSFDPPLPDDVGALASHTPVWMGGTTKVVVRYTDAFWRRRGWSGSAISHIGPMRELHDMSGPDGVPAAIFGFVSAGSDDEPTVSRARVIAQMVALFGPEAATAESVEIRDWSKEPFTSPVGVARRTRYDLFGHPTFQIPAMDGRLHWASTETSAQFAGHIEGALVAAERAVATITAGLDAGRPGQRSIDVQPDEAPEAAD